MNIVDAYRQRGSYRLAGRGCGVDHMTVKAVVERAARGEVEVTRVVLVSSRVWFVRLAADRQQARTLGLLAECVEELGGVLSVLLADRIVCVRGPIVADRVVAHPDEVRFATHDGFRPDWWASADRQSKGVVEDLVGSATSDLVIPSCADWTSLAMANTAAGEWCAQGPPAEAFLCAAARGRAGTACRPSRRHRCA